MGDIERYTPGSDLRPHYAVNLYSRGHPTESDNVYPLVLKEANLDGLGRVRHLIGQDADPDTPSGVIAVYAKEIDGILELCVRDEDNGPVLQLTQGGVLNAGQPGYIQGLVPAPVSSTALGFGTGALLINGKIYQLTTAFTNLDCSGLSADTWYYVEVTAPGSGDELSVNDFSLTTTAPTLSASLHYWERTGRRCVFAFKTDGSGNILEFVCDGREVTFSPDARIILYTTSPATSTTVLNPDLPVLGTLTFWGHVYLSMDNAQTYWVYMGPTGTVGSQSGGIAKQNAPGDYVTPFKMATKADGTVYYKTIWAGNGQLRIYVRGFALPVGMAR